MNKTCLLIAICTTFELIVAQSTIYTENPYHACQVNVCANETEVVLSSPNGVASFALVAPQIGKPINRENLETTYIDTFALSTLSSDFDWMYAMANFRHWGWHTSWNSIEIGSQCAFNPSTAASSFGSLLCGEWASTGSNLINRARVRLGLSPILMRKLWMNGHVVLEYFDAQHNDWVYCDLDGAGAGVAFVSDGNGFYASQAEIAVNPNLVLSQESIAFSDSTMSADDARYNFHENILQNGLFDLIQYTEILDTLSDEGSTNFVLSPGVEMVFYDRTGDYYHLDTTGFTQELQALCTPQEIELLMQMQADSGHTGDSTLMCVLQAMSNVNGFASLEDDFIPFMQSGQYYAYEMGLPPAYEPRFIRGGETIKVTLQPGVYDSTNFAIPLVLHKIIPENRGVEFKLNGKIYNDSKTIIKYVDRESGQDSLLNYPNNQMIEYGSSALIPEAVGSVELEFYFNYNIFPIMHQAQIMLVESGELVATQYFTYQFSLDTAVDTTLNQIVEVALLQIRAYPNPSSGIVNFSVPTTEDVEVYDSLTHLVGLIPKGALSFDLSNYPKGLYFLPRLNTKMLKT